MQTAKIKLGQLYAAKFGDEIIAFRPTAIVTTTRREGSTNVIRGYNALLEGKGEPQELGLKPEQIISDFEAHQELVAQKRAADARRKAKEEAEHALTAKAVKVLAAVIGAVPVQRGERRPTERSVPLVEARYYNLDVNFEAFEGLIKALEPLLPKEVP